MPDVFTQHPIHDMLTLAQEQIGQARRLAMGNDEARQYLDWIETGVNLTTDCVPLVKNAIASDVMLDTVSEPLKCLLKHLDAYAGKPTLKALRNSIEAVLTLLFVWSKIREICMEVGITLPRPYARGGALSN